MSVACWLEQNRLGKKFLGWTPVHKYKDHELLILNTFNTKQEVSEHSTSIARAGGPRDLS